MSEPEVSSSRLRPCPDCGRSCSIDALVCPGCGRPLLPEGAEAVQPDAMLEHILSQSSLKVGMCLTLLGLIKVVEGAKSVTSFTDELLAVTAILFLASHLVTYHAYKQPNSERKKRIGKTGDRLFMAALSMLVLICGILAFELL